MENQIQNYVNELLNINFSDCSKKGGKYSSKIGLHYTYIMNKIPYNQIISNPELCKKCALLYSWASYYYTFPVDTTKTNYPKQAFNYLKKSIRLFEKLSMKKEISHKYWWMGYCYYNIDDYKKAYRYFKKAISLNVFDGKNEAVFLDYGLICYFLNKKDESHDIFMKLIQLIIKSRGRYYFEIDKLRNIQKRCIIDLNIYVGLFYKYNKYVNNVLSVIDLLKNGLLINQLENIKYYKMLYTNKYYKELLQLQYHCLSNYRKLKKKTFLRYRKRMKYLENKIIDVINDIENKNTVNLVPENAEKIEIKLQDIQNVLKNDEAIINMYSLSDEKKIIIYIILKHDYFIETVSVNNNELTEILLNISNLIKNIQYSFSEEDVKSKSGLLKWYLNKIYNEIFRSAFQHLKNHDIIYFSPSNDFFSFPFNLLIDDNNKYIIEKYEIKFIPNIEFLLRYNNSEKITRNDKFAGFVNSTCDLMYAEEEIYEISKYFNKKNIFTRVDCSRKNLIEMSQKADILHLACHSKCSHENPFSSFIELIDNNNKIDPFDCIDISALNLCNLKLLIISSCESGYSNVSLGNEILGLIRAFFISGVKRIISTYRNINDKETVELMTYFYSYLLEDNMSISKALQLSQIKMIQENQPIYLWGAFYYAGL